MAKNKGGRPAQADGTANTININVRVNQQLLTALDDHCNKYGKARGTIVRELLENYLKRCNDGNAYSDLLRKVTEKHNAEVKARFDGGELDFVPDYSTPPKMLQMILTEYTLKNYPELLNEDQTDNQ